MFKKTFVFFFTVFFFVLLITPVFVSAAGEDIVYDGSQAYLSIERANVTARKGFPSDSFRAAGNVTVIERADIERLGASSVVDVLRREQGITVRDWTGNGKTVDVDLRGFGEAASSNLLVLVNGRRANIIDMSGTDWAQIPLSSVERIEIIRGPSAVLYGDNATGGVINIITAPLPEDKTTLTAEGGSFGRAAARLNFSGRRGETAFRVSAARESAGGYRENSGIADSDIHAFIARKTGGTKLSIDFGFHSDKYGMPGALSETDWDAGNLTKAASARNEAGTNDTYAQVSLGAALTPRFDNEVILSYRSRAASSYWRDSYDPVWFPNPGEERKTETFGALDKALFAGTPVGSVTCGIEAYFAGQTVGALDVNDVPVAGSTILRKDTLAVFAEDEIKLSGDDIIITGGARYETAVFSFKTSAASEVKISSASVAYSLGVSYLVDDKTSVYAKWATAFRTPTVDEYYSVWDGLNASLAHQLTDSVELGVKKIFGRKLSGGVSVFRADSENEIYYNPLGGAFGFGANENYAATRRIGAEAGAVYSVSKIYSLRANYTYTDAKITEGDYENSVVPAVPVHSASLTNTLTSGRFIVSLTGNYVGERYFISDQKNISPQLPAHVRADVKASYALDGVKIFAGVNNILDAKYAEYGVSNIAGTARNYYPSPSRNFFGGVEINF